MKASANYTRLALIYPHIMRFIGYKDWADYILNLVNFLEVTPDKVLEIAAGNGKISSILENKFQSYIVSDRSKEMLSIGKVGSFGRVCCDMRAIPFNCGFDFIFSTFDSVNYLTTEEMMLQLFGEVRRVLKPDGFFTFDVSLENNSIRHEKKLNRKGIFNGIRYRQKSRFDRESGLHFNDFLIRDTDGTIYSENHVQKIYRFDDYFKMIEKSNLIISHCFDAFTFDDADRESDRVQFVIKRGNLC